MTTADERYTQSLWYAWGMADSGAIPGLTLDHGWTFAQQQREAQEAFTRQEVCFMPSIIGAWETFLAQREMASPAMIANVARQLARRKA